MKSRHEITAQLEAELQKEVDAIFDRLSKWCITENRWVSADGRVNLETAAAILGIAPGTLRNWQCTNKRIRFHRSSPRGRVRFLLRDLAENIAKNCHD